MELKSVLRVEGEQRYSGNGSYDYFSFFAQAECSMLVKYGKAGILDCIKLYICIINKNVIDTIEFMKLPQFPRNAAYQSPVSQECCLLV